MAGGVTSKRGATLAERSAGSGLGRTPARARHCWVAAPDGPERWPALLVEWRRGPDGWLGRCVYLVEDGGQSVVVEAWVAATQLAPL